METLLDRVENKEREINVGKYDLRFPIGKGSFGTVYFTTDDKCEYLATKVGSRVDNNSDEMEGEFLRIITMDKDARKYVPHFKDFFIVENSSLLIMEYINGTSFHEFLKAAPQDFFVINPGFLISIYTQLIYGLETIHNLDIAHRDIKPANIVITPNHRIKYVDFGLSCSNKNKCRGRHGTLKYQPKEVILHKYDSSISRIDRGKKHDVWSLSLILYQIANRSLPFSVSLDERWYVESQIINNVNPQSNYKGNIGNINEFCNYIIDTNYITRLNITQLRHVFKAMILDNL